MVDGATGPGSKVAHPGPRPLTRPPGGVALRRPGADKGLQSSCLCASHAPVVTFDDLGFSLRQPRPNYKDPIMGQENCHG